MTSAAPTATTEAMPPMEQMMEEISAGTETMRLEQRLECLKEADKKIGELMNIVTEVGYIITNPIMNILF